MRFYRRHDIESGVDNVIPITKSQLPMLHLSDTVRHNVIAVLGEFVGTFMFLFLAFAGTQTANTPGVSATAPPDLDHFLYSSLSFGFSLMANVWAFYRVTGGLFNPVVTLALCLVGDMSVFRGVLVFAAQIVGAIAAAGVVSAILPGPFEVSSRLGAGTSTSQGLFMEMFMTAQLVFVIIMLAVVKHKSTFLAPVGIGITFFVNELIGHNYTGSSLNPARSLAPDIINRNFPRYHWIYWVGPLLGSLLACGFFALLKLFDYHTANPGQDYNEWEDQMKEKLSTGNQMVDGVHSSRMREQV